MRFTISHRTKSQNYIHMMKKRVLKSCFGNWKRQLFSYQDQFNPRSIEDIGLIEVVNRQPFFFCKDGSNMTRNNYQTSLDNI
jgi:hypothetical protein